MPRGGARIGSGPPPNPQSRKQTGSQSSSWVDLPAEGYRGPVPEWPFDLISETESDIWGRIWRTPQASAWVRMGWTFDVAMYVTFAAAVGDPDAELADTLKASTEARQWSDRLGLNPAAMLRNRWRVVEDETEDRRDAPRSKRKPTRRLKVVDDAVAGS